jgi:trehalose/maltose hydrolase-like predicted phosphorylase
MPLISQTLSYANQFRQQFGLAENATWDDMAKNVLVIRENGVTLEFTTMNGSAVVKQADVVLNTYPLDYTANYNPQDSLNDLDYVSTTQTHIESGKHPKLTLHSTRTSNPPMDQP